MTFGMDPRMPAGAFLAFRLTLGAVLLFSSFPLAAAAMGTGRSRLAILAGAEALGAILFLLPRTLRVGAVILLLTLGIAIATRALRGEFPAHLIVYAAGTLFVLAQGPTGPVAPSEP
jgi:hypothetical protein